MARLKTKIDEISKTGGILGYAFTVGIVSLSIKTVIPNISARTQTPQSRRTFYF